MLAPALAAAGSTTYQDDLESGAWLGLGLGGGKIATAGQAPSADRGVFTFNLDAGYRITPQWGIGFEFGVIGPTSGCDGLGCTPASPDFAPNFLHWFAVGEYRPDNTGWRLRAGAGFSTMCYRYYRSHTSALENFVNVLLGGDGSTSDSISCHSLKAFGAAASIGYQWSLRGSPTSLGLQLRGEAANFSASTRAVTPAFHHRAVTLQLQLNMN